ncbi:heavy metal translocating P-type ATPase [Actinomadura namibiensis]|uniref:Cu2+-exporting ATPase n=1 Tax=Actinomadura namibiensis TaxID=182080 RepID=A0A7W3QPJ6_ACTNM|nr:heavy metal translocating P-type ATPase [Actinomadura namibiensis]MBA8954717.1 Cu2+-exporting ATPase [Actinomadura namibiensis]
MGHDGHGDRAARFRDRLWGSLALSAPVLVYGDTLQHWFGYAAPRFPGSHWIAPVFGTLVLLHGGRPFLSGAVDEAAARRPGTMLLITQALALMYAAGLAAALGLLDLDLWGELALLVDVLLLGHWLEARAFGQAPDAPPPDVAERVEDGTPVTVAAGELRVGDTVLVRPGARVPADATVTEGTAAFDEAPLTGRARPVERGPGSAIAAGTVATDAAVHARVTAVGEDTALAGIHRLVDEARRASADRAAGRLYSAATGAAVAAVAVWLLLGEPERAVRGAVSVLVVACPHALGLAAPLVVAVCAAAGARAGILVRDRRALDRMRAVDTVLFGKTGTLTTGRPEVAGTTADGDAGTLLALAAAAESASGHPLARAIVRAAGDGRASAATGFRSLPGIGVETRVDGRRVAVGGPALLRSADAPAGPFARTAARWGGEGATVVYVLVDGAVAGALAVHDPVRPEAAEAVAALRAAGRRVAMVTGDARPAAEAAARRVGIEEIYAGVLPVDKGRRVRALREGGRAVAMVGDGVADAPALAMADVGVAIGAGAAARSADVVLASADPRAVASVLRLSEAAHRTTARNLAWVVGYHAVAVPPAAGALAWAGVPPSPVAAAAAAGLATLVVALNTRLPRRLDLTRRTGPAK